MTMIFRSPWRAANGLTCALLILVATAFAAQRLTPAQEKQKWSRVARQVCQMIESQHISQGAIDDAISIKTLEQFIKDLDSQKIYFLKSDIEEFNRSRTLLDDQLKAGDLHFGFEVYKTYLQRVKERVEAAHKLIDAEHDFTVSETLPIDPKEYDFAETEAALTERWRKRIKYDLLLLKLDKSPDARKRLHTRYNTLQFNVSRTEEAEMVEAYLTSLCMAFDPHSAYMSPRNSNEFEVQMKLRLEGIGAALKSEDGYTIVAQIVPGGAAADDGRLKVGDKIVGVSDEKGTIVDVVEMKLTQVVDLIRGPKGTEVSLRVVPAVGGGTDTKVYQLKRKQIELKQAEVKGEIIETEKRVKGLPNTRVGIIHIPSFYRDFQGAESGNDDFKSTSRDVHAVLNDFKKKGVDCVVIDLRTNGGGALAEAIEVTGLFIDQGPVVQVKTQRGKVKKLLDEEPGVVYSGPLVVLTNRLSASASEIFAGAIKDYGRGLVVGDRTTHGKGTVQSVMNVGRGGVFALFEANTPSEGALKLTINQFYRVDGASTQNLGVPSDVVLPSLLDNMDLGESFLDNAMKYDQIKEAEHDNWGYVTPEIKSYLQEASRKRVSQDPEFQKSVKDIERYLARKQRKTVTLKEDELRKERIEEEQKTRDKAEQPDEITEGPVFPVNSYNNEALAVTLDYLSQVKRLITARK